MRIRYKTDRGLKDLTNGGQKGNSNSHQCNSTVKVLEGGERSCAEITFDYEIIWLD